VFFCRGAPHEQCTLKVALIAGVNNGKLSHRARRAKVAAGVSSGTNNIQNQSASVSAAGASRIIGGTTTINTAPFFSRETLNFGPRAFSRANF
jgi:hypothetical protein